MVSEPSSLGKARSQTTRPAKSKETGSEPDRRASRRSYQQSPSKCSTSSKSEDQQGTARVRDRVNVAKASTTKEASSRFERFVP